MITNIVHAACLHECPDTCAIRVTVENGRAVKVQGDPDHPPTHGALCTKVSRYPERTHHAERVLRPMKRSGLEGLGRFVPVSWDEALGDIAARLQAIAARDAQAIVPYGYAGTMRLIQGEAMSARFFHRLGASLLDRTICSIAGGEALAATDGGKVGMHLEFFAESKLILIWGSNSIASNLHFWTFAQAVKRNGAQLICIDPRVSETADKCHQPIALLPGTDGALALGLMHELIVGGWLDDDYIAQHFDAAGWPTLRERALQWPPERVAAVCGITADEVRGLARDYGTTRPAAIRMNHGMQRLRGSGNATRLIARLPCLTSAWRERAGGLLFSSSGWFRSVRNDAALRRPDPLEGCTPRLINMSTIGDDLLRKGDDLLADGTAFGPKIEALIVHNSNPVAVAPESPKVVRGFARDDLFTVVLDHFMTDTADHADHVLPATTHLEHLDVHTSCGLTWVMLNEAAVAPLGEAKPNTQIFREPAERMGFDEACFSDDDDDDEALTRVAFSAQVDFDALRATGWFKLPIADAPLAEGGFPTADGRCIVASPAHGVPDHVANYEAAASAPELARRYPLAMISPPARNFLNSTFVNVRSLRDIEGEPLVKIRTADTQARGIGDGAIVRVLNDRGSYLCRARVSRRARPGAVNGLRVWWRKLGAAGSNVNELTHQQLTGIGRAPSFSDCLVEVRPAAAGACAVQPADASARQVRPADSAAS